jgi:hypothetical protein
MPASVFNTVNHELGHYGSGLYAWLAHDNIDKNGNAMYKIGWTDNLAKRMNNYETGIPVGVTLVTLMSKIPIKKWFVPKQYPVTRRKWLLEIERFIFEELKEYRYIQVTTNRRKKTTEFFYTNVDNVQDAFDKALDKFGTPNKTQLDNYVLPLMNANLAKNKKSKRPYFVGETIYFLDVKSDEKNKK